MGFVKWRQTAQDKFGQEQLGERLFFLDSGTTEERKKERKKELRRVIGK
jgi:hypothetical protein